MLKYPVAEHDLAYAAGLFDGEGCVTLRGNGKDAVALQVVVSMYGDLCDWLQDRFGGGVYENGSTCPRWVLTGKKCEPSLSIMGKHVSDERTKLVRLKLQEALALDKEVIRKRSRNEVSSC